MKKLFLAFGLAVVLKGAVFSQSSVVPIVELKHRGLLGGVQNGKWIPATRVAPAIGSQSEFVLIGWNGVEEGGVTLGRKGEQEDVCPDFTRIEFELTQPDGIAIGSQAKWNFVPRQAEKIEPTGPTYRKIVADFLKTKNIPRPNVKITQAFRIDLEGDGVDEVLIAATYYKNGLSSSANVGDYSFVIIRKAVGKTVTNHVLVGDFITKRVDFGAPTENAISAIADLNGDGKMEIVLNGSYYEGDFASAFEMKNGKPVKIKEFDIGCGV